jgi:hypothetical protein
MSAEYLRAFVRATDDAPLEVQRSISEIQGKDCEARELLSLIKDMLANLQNVPSDEKKDKLTEIREHTLKLGKIMKAQSTISDMMGASIKSTGMELQQQRDDYKTGAYKKKEQAERERLAREEREAAERRRKEALDEERRNRPPPQPLQQQRPPKKLKKNRPKEKEEVTPIKKPKKPNNRPRYCTPNCLHQDGEMVGCDNDNCSHGEWFHLQCVGLKVSPAEDKKWFCPTCKKEMGSDFKSKKKKGR